MTKENLIKLVMKDKDVLYKHCMICGGIYDNGWQVLLVKNGAGNPLGKEFNEYKISSGVCSPDCESELKRRYGL